jgi:hypothetical protein
LTSFSSSAAVFSPRRSFSCFSSSSWITKCLHYQYTPQCNEHLPRTTPAQQPDSASKYASKQEIMKMRTFHGNNTYFSHTSEAPVGTICTAFNQYT